MGAKAPEKLKLRRQSCKCHDCGRKFLNTQALSSHRKFMHKPKSVATKRDAKKPTDMQDAKVVKKKVVSPPDSKTTAQLPTPKVTNKNSSKVIIEVSSAKKATVVKKTEFKCPKCVKVFCVYFSASRHIQKYHCVDENDKPVASDSPDIVKPIRVELCESCKKYTATSETHTCETVPNVKLDRCMCLGCQKTFEGLTLFEQHIKTTHTHRADCLFFTSNNDYATWKTELEAITKIKFVSSGTPEPKSKQIYYHCSHQSSVKSDKTLLCPSMYSVTELSNGYRVVYYKEHFGHSSTDLSPLVYKKYSILPFLKDVDIQNIDSDDHVHQQLRSIVNNVTANAAKADIGVLYSLLEKALAMTVVLNNVSAEDHNVVNKSMSDEQITEVLSDVKIYPGKRKSEAVKKDVKQPKLEVDNNENLKTNTVTNKTVTRKAVESLASTPLKQIIQSSPSSFNDSYKDFVESNFKPGLDSSTAKKNVAKKKAVVKTKIGQFKVRPSLSPKVDEEIQTSLPENDKPNLSPKRLRTTLSPKTQISKPNERPVSSPKTQISKPNERPVSSPKTVKPTPKLIEPKIRPDFEYEVREQENDCNILILKF